MSMENTEIGDVIYWLLALLNKWNAMGKDWIYTENTQARLTCLHSMAAGRLLAE